MNSGKACHFKKEEFEIITEQVQKQNTCCYRLNRFTMHSIMATERLTVTNKNTSHVSM